MTRRRKRTTCAITIAEAAAMMALIFPICVACLFVVMETSQAYLISNSLDQAARQAARNIAMSYHKNPSIASNNSQCLSSCCAPVCKPPGTAGACVTDTSQFGGATGAGTSITFSNLSQIGAQGNTTQVPTVTVTCTYISNNTTKLPPFPQYDVLKLMSVPGFKLMSTAIYQIQ